MSETAETHDDQAHMFSDYIKHLEKELSSCGYRKVCSYCELACHPIWSNSDPKQCTARCELCTEQEKGPE